MTFTSTYYKSHDGKGEYRYLLEEILGVDGNDRFSEAAEAAILTEALKTSYAEAAKVLPSKQAITKTTVMNKVHQIAEEMPYEAPEEKRQCRYLFIEADEEHVAEQHGRWGRKEDNGSFQSRLAYVYEYKQEVNVKDAESWPTLFISEGYIAEAKGWNSSGKMSVIT